MKNYNIFLILGAVALLLCSSCEDFLTRDPESKIPAEAVFESPENTNAYILGMYKEWRDCHKTWGSYALGTDEYKLGGVQVRDNEKKRGIEFYSSEMIPTNNITLDFWKERYQIVSKATLAIDKLKDKAEGDTLMTRYLAEAYALRGACYFELVQHFGEIPLNNTEIIEEHGSRRQPLSLVYATIVADFENALKGLPEPTSTAYAENRRRFSNAFAHAMLGKTYLYAYEESGFRNYAKAAEHFKIVYEEPAFGNTGASSPSIIFDETGKSHDDYAEDYEKEMIYAFRFSNTRGDNNEFAWNFGSRAVSVMTAIEATIYFAGFDNILPTKYSYSMREDGGLWEKGDLRRAVSIRDTTEFVYNGKKPVLLGYCYGDELDPHIRKYEDKRIEELGLNTWYSGKPYPYVRFADIVLCYAECLYFMGEQTRAITMVNEKVRGRSFQGRPISWATNLNEEEFMEHMMDERMRELCFEGWRRMDLLRTGTVEKYVIPRNNWYQHEDYYRTTVDKTRFRFPIPLDEISMNPDMTTEDQNPGY